MKIYAKFLEKVTWSKRIKDRKSQPMYKYTFAEVSKHIYNLKKLKKKTKIDIKEQL